MMQALSISYFGKYREIVLAVAFFLVFDLAVLLLNFYISFQLSDSAQAINLAGRQRMLSQRMTKALLVVQQDGQRGASPVEALAELNKTVTLFDTTLLGFEHGATVTGGDDKPASLVAVTTLQGREILQKADALWRPYKALLEPLTGDAPYSPEQLDAAASYARHNNLVLLALMNSLTSHLEQTANTRVDRLRIVQTAGILLALLNFAFILLKFLRRLSDNDRKIEAARKETAEILGTVKEGLLLLDADFRIGSQYSRSLPDILGRKIEPGSDFRAVLKSMVKASVFASACDYIALLLGDRVKESLVVGLNPLTQVEVTVGAATGAAARRFLTLQFNRVMDKGKISHLLVTVSDVTVQVELERALADAKIKAQGEVTVMLDLLKVNPAALGRFLSEAERLLLDINDRLRSAGGLHDYRSTIALIFRQIHTLKGDAAALGLEMFEALAHQFESLLNGLRAKGTMSGDDLVALPLPLEEFLQRIALVRDLTARLSAFHNAYGPAASADFFADNLATLAQRIALDQGKEVQLVADLSHMGSLPAHTRSELEAIAVQLLRNAVVHGIEPAEERALRQKPAGGSIYVGLKPVEDGEYEFVLRDDGRGLMPQRIRAALLTSGRYSEAQLNELDDKEVLMKIFEPGFSTAALVSRDAGQGVGLDVVKQKIEQLSARLRVATRDHAYTLFCLRFSV